MNKLSPKAKLMGEVFRFYMAGILIITLLMCFGVRWLWSYLGLHSILHVDDKFGIVILMVSWVVVIAKNKSFSIGRRKK